MSSKAVSDGELE